MNTDKIARYLWLGRRDKDWYAECRAVFIELFGEEKLPLVAKLFAATSINTSLKSNVRLFRKAMWEIEHGKPVGDYLPNIKLQLQRIRDGGELSGRKISSFARAMQGDPLAVVVDIWISRAFEICDMEGKFSPSDKQYSTIENWILHEARAMHLEPASFTAMIWSGIRKDSSADRDTHYKTLLRFHLQNLWNVI